MSNADEPVLRATAPGRVNLIGDHTDYMGGLALPMTVPMHTVIEGRRVAGRISLRSDAEPDPLDIRLPVLDPRVVTPAWGRYIAGVAHLSGAEIGIAGTVTSDLPVGAGLSSSAALEVATALALGVDGSPLEIAALCQRAEQVATGVPSGIMDQLAILAAEPDSATLIDFTAGSVDAVSIPADFRFWVVDSGQRRTLDGSAYAERREQCEQAAALIGPLPGATAEDIATLRDPLIRARARHVANECRRVQDFAAALDAHDVARAGELMTESHRSLRDDFEVSTPALEACVDALLAVPGVHGARLTGAGFGGCVVALADPGVELSGWAVAPSGPARLELS